MTTVSQYFPEPFVSNIPQIWSGTGVTGAGGILTITFPTPFPSAPAVTVTGETTGTNALTDIHIHSVSTTAVTIHARWSPSITLLGIQLLTFPSNAVGLTVHIHAIEQGDFV